MFGDNDEFKAKNNNTQNFQMKVFQNAKIIPLNEKLDTEIVGLTPGDNTDGIENGHIYGESQKNITGPSLVMLKPRQ